jgi:hypothetical protein
MEGVRDNPQITQITQNEIDSHKKAQKSQKKKRGEERVEMNQNVFFVLFVPLCGSLFESE